MKKILSIITVACLLSSMQLSAQLDRSKAPLPGPAPKVEMGDFNKFTLSNGLRVIVVEDHERPIVNYSLIFLTDPSIEGEKAGMSSMFGDIWEKGTKTRTADQISDEVEFLGARLSTSANRIGFFSLKKYQTQMLSVMTDVLYNPTFPEEELVKIKEQNLGGLKMAKTDPSSIMNNIITATVYGKDHAYGDIMTEETVNAVTTDDFRTYYKKNIIPNNAIMIVVGDVTVKEVQKLCKKYFGSWKKGKVESHEWPLGRKANGIEVVFSPKDGAVQSTICMMAPIDYKQTSEDNLALKMSNAIYGGGGFSAKLMKNLREDKGYTYGAYSRVSTDRFSGSFKAQGDVNATATANSFIEMRKELDAMLASDYEDGDLHKTKVAYAGAFSRSLESSGTIADNAFFIERFNMPKDYFATYLQRLDAITREDVDAATRKYLDPNNMYYFVVGDPSVLPSLQELDSDGVVEILDYLGRPLEQKEVDADVTVESIVDRYMDAIGGIELANGVKDVTNVTDMSVMGMVMTTTTKIIPAEKAFSSVQAMGGNPMMTMVLKNGSLQVSQGGMSQTVSDPAQIEAVAGEQLDIFPEMTLKYEIAGIENIDGKDAYKLKAESAAGVVYDFFDIATGLKVKSVVMAQGQTVETIYVEYAVSEYGIKYPSVLKMTMPQIGEVDAKVTMSYNTGLTVDSL